MTSKSKKLKNRKRSRAKRKLLHRRHLVIEDIVSPDKVEKAFMYPPMGKVSLGKITKESFADFCKRKI